MIDKKIPLNDDKQFKFLQEGSNRILSKLQSYWSCSHKNCCQRYMLHINLHILYIQFIKLNLNLKEFQESIGYFKSYQVNKIGYFVELYFNLNLHSNLNIKPDFQVNSQFSTFLHESHVNVKEFFSTSHHVITVLNAIHDSYHDSKGQP